MPLCAREPLAQPVALTETVAERERVGLPEAEAQRETLTVAEAQRLPLPLRAGLALALAQRLAERDCVGLPVAEGQRVAVGEGAALRLAAPLREGVRLALPQGLAEGDSAALLVGAPVPVTEALPHDEGETLRLAVGLGDSELLGDWEGEVETLRVALLQRVRASLKVGDSGKRDSVGLGEGEPETVPWEALPLAEAEVHGL